MLMSFIYIQQFTILDITVIFWNANPEDPEHIRSVRDLALGNQASIFSGITNIYSPLYRQIFYDGLVYHNSSNILTEIALDPILKRL